MRAWRICRQPFVAQALDGLGGLHAGGRWHHQGQPIVYAASTAALAALEVLVHVDPALAPHDLRLLALDIPDDIGPEPFDRRLLPADWQHHPAPARLQDLGSAWLASRRSCILQVPSAVMPVEDNLLLNPTHPDIARIRITFQQPFAFDPRLLT